MGRCAACGRLLHSGHWQVDHKIALINGGEHRESNLEPLCDKPCHALKTGKDVAEKSKVYAKKKSRLLKKPRTITRWRTFNGTIKVASRDR